MLNLLLNTYTIIWVNICAALKNLNVFLNGKKKPSSSFKNSFLSFSEDFASILPIRKSVKETNNTDIGVSLFSKPKNIDLNKKGLEKSFMRADEGVSINSLLSEIDFLQNNNLNKQLFFY